MSDKATIRQEMRARRKALSPDAKARASGIVCDKILSHSNVHAALDPFDGFGYGGGWYDRLMADAVKGAMKIGVAHAFQVVKNLPSEPHDIKIDEIIDDSLEHPQVDYANLPDGCRVHVHIAHRRRWWTAFFGGLVGVLIFPLLVTGALALARGHLAFGGGIALLILGALVVLVGLIALLYGFGGPFEAELELQGEWGVCRRRWLGLVPWKTLRFKWHPWTRFASGGYAFCMAPGKTLLSVGEGAVVRPLFRTDAEIVQRLSIRLNHSRVISPDRLRAARENLFAKLPRGMTISHDADGATVAVWAPSL